MLPFQQQTIKTAGQQNFVVEYAVGPDRSGEFADRLLAQVLLDLGLQFRLEENFEAESAGKKRYPQIGPYHRDTVIAQVEMRLGLKQAFLEQLFNIAMLLQEVVTKIEFAAGRMRFGEQDRERSVAGPEIFEELEFCAD